MTHPANSHIADFIIIPIVFYFVVLVGRFDLQDLRDAGWIFNTGGTRDPWYKFYTMFGTLGLCLINPTMKIHLF
jgi:hypothetical protein